MMYISITLLINIFNHDLLVSNLDAPNLLNACKQQQIIFDERSFVLVFPKRKNLNKSCECILTTKC